MGPEVIQRLWQDPLLWLEEGGEGKPIVKSCMPSCQFCNSVSPTHFPLKCTHAWENWEIRQYPCYKCQRDRADHIAEECWVGGNWEQTKEELQEGLHLHAQQMEYRLDGNLCLVCGDSLESRQHTIEDCLEDYTQTLKDTETLVFSKTEVAWKIHEGGIEITQKWTHPVSGLAKCGFCNQR